MSIAGEFGRLPAAAIESECILLSTAKERKNIFAQVTWESRIHPYSSTFIRVSIFP